MACWQQTTNDTKSYENCRQPCDESIGGRKTGKSLGVYQPTVSVASWPKGNFLAVGNSRNHTVYSKEQIAVKSYIYEKSLIDHLLMFFTITAYLANGSIGSLL